MFKALRKRLRAKQAQRLAQSLREGPARHLLAAQARLAMGPVAPLRADLGRFGGRFIRYTYKTPRGLDVRNLGDYLQSEATELAVRAAMGEAVAFTPWPRNALSWYDGPPAICVMQGWYEHDTLRFLPNRNVLPVWVGTHFERATRERLAFLAALDRDLLTDWEFGCRDLSTLEWCRSQGLAAYFSRCLTLTLPTRGPARRDKLFLVGPDAWRERVQNALPRALREARPVVCADQLVTGERALAERDHLPAAKTLLQTYRDEAALVITSRIHCAQPCLAMGIPVVFIDPVNKEAERFSTLRGLIPIHSFDDLKAGKVDLAPEPPDLAPLKRAMLENLRLSILEACGDDVERARLADLRADIAAFRCR